MKKELEQFLTTTLRAQVLCKRKNSITMIPTRGLKRKRQSEEDEKWWASIYTDIREYYVPLNILEKFIATSSLTFLQELRAPVAQSLL